MYNLMNQRRRFLQQDQQTPNARTKQTPKQGAPMGGQMQGDAPPPQQGGNPGQPVSQPHPQGGDAPPPQMQGGLMTANPGQPAMGIGGQAPKQMGGAPPPTGGGAPPGGPAYGSQPQPGQQGGYVPKGPDAWSGDQSAGSGVTYGKFQGTGNPMEGFQNAGNTFQRQPPQGGGYGPGTNPGQRRQVGGQGGQEMPFRRPQQPPSQPAVPPQQGGDYDPFGYNKQNGYAQGGGAPSGPIPGGQPSGNAPGPQGMDDLAGIANTGGKPIQDYNQPGGGGGSI